MKTAKSVVLCAMIIVQTVKGQNNNHKIYLEADLCAGIQQTSFVSGVSGAIGFYLTKNHSFDIRAKELYNFSDQNIIGPITFNYRYNFNNGLFIGGGFAHHHEVTPNIYIPHPVEAAMGSYRDIFHRTGMDVEVGYNFKPFAKKGFFSVIYPCANVVATFMFIDQGYNPLITANVGIKIGLKKFN